MKRFWDTATIAPADGGYAILLDGKPMRLPAGPELRVGAEPLARAIAAEWQAAGGQKGGEMSFADTPLTRLAGTLQERIAPNPAPVVAALARYAENDMLCYRAERPESLVHRQARAWQPWLDWAALTYDAPLKVTAGITHVRQDPLAVAALRRAVERLDVAAVAALGVAVPALGSLVLGLALAEGKLDAAEAHALGALEELYEVDQWGEDPEAAARRKAIADDIALAARFIALTQEPPAP